MSVRAVAAGLLGAAGGAVVAALALGFELLARDASLGGVIALHRSSVTVWVVDSLPLVLGVASFAVVFRGDRVPPAPAPPPPPPTGGRTAAPALERRGPPPAPPAAGRTALPAPPPAGSANAPAPGGAPGQADHRVQALQELLKSVREQADRSEKESRQKSRTVAQMAHELRTPLAAIVGHAELLEEDSATLGAERLEEVRKIVRSARQLAGLVNDILDLSRLEIGALPLALEDVDLAQVVDEVRVVVQPLAERNQNRFAGHVTPGARFARGDHLRVRQVLVGLIEHAFRSTRGGQVALTAEAGREGGAVLRVKDNGAGMSPDELQRLLDGASPQTGLGVSIARRLVDLMGGRLEADSVAGKGTTFSVVLPPSARREADVAPRSTLALNERLAGLGVLVVDAEPGGVTLFRYLERVGLLARLVTDLRSAEVAVRAENPQLVLVDVGLPGMWDFVDDLVASKVKVVATSLRDEDVDRALEAGVTAFLVRPLERRLVLATFERCLE